VFNQLGPKHIAAETSGNQPETSLWNSIFEIFQEWESEYKTY
jgi:hypothetical protein